MTYVNGTMWVFTFNATTMTRVADMLHRNEKQTLCRYRSALWSTFTLTFNKPHILNALIASWMFLQTFKCAVWTAGCPSLSSHCLIHQVCLWRGSIVMPLQFFLDSCSHTERYTLSFTSVGNSADVDTEAGRDCAHISTFACSNIGGFVDCAASPFLMFQHRSCEKEVFTFSFWYCSWGFMISSADFAWVRW